MQNLISELTRRNVFKVGVAYAVVAWLFMQVAAVISQLFPILPCGQANHREKYCSPGQLPMEIVLPRLVPVTYRRLITNSPPTGIAKPLECD